VQRESASGRSLSEATLKAYGDDFAGFRLWCETADRQFLPASSETVLEYLARLLRDGRRPKSCTRIATSLNHAHVVAGLTPPCPSTRAVIEELQRRVPEAFSGDGNDDSHDWREERQGVLRVLERMQRHSLGFARIGAILTRLVKEGRHLRPNDPWFFARTRDGEESYRIVCRLCGGAIAYDQLPTLAEFAQHRCGEQ